MRRIRSVLFAIAAFGSMLGHMSPAGAAASPPGAPVLVSTIAASGQITVTFNAPASDGGSPILDYTARAGLGYKF